MAAANHVGPARRPCGCLRPPLRKESSQRLSPIGPILPLSCGCLARSSHSPLESFGTTLFADWRAVANYGWSVSVGVEVMGKVTVRGTVGVGV